VHHYPTINGKCLYNFYLIKNMFSIPDLKKEVPSKIDYSNLNIDHLDREIATLLQEDCRLSYYKVAAKASVAVGTAFNRIKKLEKKGIVKGYSAILDWDKLGFNLTSVIFVQTEGGYRESLEEEIATSSQVIAVYDITGEFDTAIIAKFRDRNQLNVFIKQLAANLYVKRTITSVSLNTIKEDFRINLLMEKC
jgi:DNA-binding Lrp family transcriptional regulator